MYRPTSGKVLLCAYSSIIKDDGDRDDDDRPRFRGLFYATAYRVELPGRFAAKCWATIGPSTDVSSLRIKCFGGIKIPIDVIC